MYVILLAYTKNTLVTGLILICFCQNEGRTGDAGNPLMLVLNSDMSSFRKLGHPIDLNIIALLTLSSKQQISLSSDSLDYLLKINMNWIVMKLTH